MESGEFDVGRLAEMVEDVDSGVSALLVYERHISEFTPGELADREAYRRRNLAVEELVDADFKGLERAISIGHIPGQGSVDLLCMANEFLQDNFERLRAYKRNGCDIDDRLFLDGLEVSEDYLTGFGRENRAETGLEAAMAAIRAFQSIAEYERFEAGIVVGPYPDKMVEAKAYLEYDSTGKESRDKEAEVRKKVVLAPVPRHLEAERGQMHVKGYIR